MNKILMVVAIVVLIAGGILLITRADKTQTPLATQTSTTTQTPRTTQTLPPQTQINNEAIFNIKGSNLTYDIKELSVTEGDTVTINFESTEGFHDLVIDEFRAATEQVDVGIPTSVTFVANKAGEFEYYCSVGNHKAMGMVGKLTVVAKQQ